MAKKLVEVDNLSIHFKNQRNNTKAVDGVNLYINKGEVVSVVGESGSGKTTLGRAILSLIPFTDGKVKFDGQYIPSTPELRKKYNNHKWMAKNMQMIFQDPYDSLHPTWNVFKALTQGVKYNSPFIEKGRDIRKNKDLILWKVYFSFIQDTENKKLADKLIKVREVEIKSLTRKMNRQIITIKSELKSALNRRTSIRFEEYETEQERFEELHKNSEFILSKKKELKAVSKKQVRDETKKLESEIKAQVEKWKTEFNTEIDKEVSKELRAKVSGKKKELFAEFAEFKKAEKAKLKVAAEALDEKLKNKEISKNQYSSSKVNATNEYNFKALDLKRINDEKLEEFTVEAIKGISAEYAYTVAKFMNKNEISRFRFYKHKAFLVGISSKFLEAVGLSGSILNQPVSDLSGGQRQRISIARTLMMNPKFLVADEPISALDVSIQAQVINILKSLVNKLDISMLFIAHDLRMVRYISDRMYIMFRGKIVEYGDTESIFKNPIHPYTKTLLSAIPSIKIIRKGIESFKYDFSKDLKERHTHSHINVSTNEKEHFVLGTEELIKEWKKTTKEFKANFNFD